MIGRRRPPTPRTCFRCGRGFAGKAGRVVDGRPACPSCANALRPEVACTCCGRPTKRPGRSAGHGGLVCEPCTRKDTHATCRTCRRHRAVAGRDGEGRPLCRACAADVPVTHACPACGRGTPGGGAARCSACELAGRVARSVEAGAATLRQDWVRELFTAFCGWDGLRRERGDMPRHIAAYARFFAAIDAACGSAAEVTQARLIELHGAEGLRRGFQAVAFLAGRLALAWDPNGVADANERRRVVDVMAAADKETWAGDLQAYRDHLAAGPAIAPATARMYVSAAAALLRSAGVGAAELSQRHVARHLRRSPGRRTNLLRFLSWASGRSGQAFRSGSDRRTSPRKLEKSTLKRAAVLLEHLVASHTVPVRRAILAATIAVAHGLPLKQVLALRRLDGAMVGVTLAEPLATALRGMMGGRPGLVFLGRNGLQSLSYSAVRHHVQASPTTDRVHHRTDGPTVLRR